jgi:hypothetical protein
MTLARRSQVIIFDAYEIAHVVGIQPRPQRQDLHDREKSQNLLVAYAYPASNIKQMARVQILRETRSGDPCSRALCLQWCRYVPNASNIDTTYGYRFIWRGPEGDYEATRAQALLPSMAQGKQLMDQATAQGWGNRDGDTIAITANRLREHGMIVDLARGYVGWPNNGAAGGSSPDVIKWSQLIFDWS